MRKALLLLVLATGCTGVTQSYVAADRATYDAIADEYDAYVTKDPSLSQDRKDRRTETTRSWKARLAQAEGPR